MSKSVNSVRALEVYLATCNPVFIHKSAHCCETGLSVDFFLKQLL